jgi:hypothetical protein
MTVSRIDTSLDESFIKCRNYLHAWDEFFPITLEPPMYGWRLSLRCIRCGTERHDNIDFKGRVMGRRYIYPQGYAQKGVPKVEFREALYLKLKAKLDHANQVGAIPPEIAKRRSRKAAG